MYMDFYLKLHKFQDVVVNQMLSRYNRQFQVFIKRLTGE